MLRASTIRQITAYEFQERLQVDLVDMSKYAWENNGFKWIITIVDVYSKLAWATPLKNKTANTVAKAIRPILEQYGPKYLQSDNGKEFSNDQMTALCEELEVKQIYGSPYNPQSQGQVERFNRTLKNFIFRQFTLYKTTVWVDALKTFVDQYNNTIHEATGAKPNSHTRNKEPRLPEVIKMKGLELKVGDKVRLSLRTSTKYRKNRFQRHYTPN